ncbi:NAD(P)-dependent oxidoreductase [Pedobacter frigoris]|uniref:NAD-dependent epimerase/dehydratase family protein n=1 Tax=Pedobacter frigoris TaxID=2571272 RepID=UPI002931855C|nr:NAD(P)-dependent oxidoreductase [Pedobacter frigoris]
MSKKVLITGATGFVGYHLIEKALAAGLEVFAAVRKSSDVSHLKAFNITYVDLDYSSVDILKTQLEANQYNYIIHAAGITKAKTADDYNKVNAGYAKNLALAAVVATIPLDKFVFVSSLAALGPRKDLNGVIEDDSEGHPVTSYGSSKLIAEQYLKEIKGLPLVVIRPTAVYGPREKDIFILFKSINQGIEPYIGSFKQQLTFVYVKDLADVIISALNSKVSGRSYNVTDGHVYDRYSLGKFARKALDKKTFKFHLPIFIVSAMASIMDILYTNSKETPTLNREKMAELTAVNWACNIDHALKDLDYRPAFDLESGLNETMEWYKTNKWL